MFPLTTGTWDTWDKTSINFTKPANLLVQPAVFLCLFKVPRSEFLDALHWTGCQQADNYDSLVFLILSHMTMINARAQQPFHGHLSLSPNKDVHPEDSIMIPKDQVRYLVLLDCMSEVRISLSIYMLVFFDNCTSCDRWACQDEINLWEAQHVAEDRERWRELIVALHVSQGMKRIKWTWHLKLCV